MKKNTGAGKYRNLLIFQEKTETKDSNFGSVIEDWLSGPSFEVMGAFEHAGSKEFPAVQKRFEQTTCRFRIRYREGINADRHRVIFILDRDANPVLSQTFNITPPVDPTGRRRELVIEASEIK